MSDQVLEVPLHACWVDAELYSMCPKCMLNCIVLHYGGTVHVVLADYNQRFVVRGGGSTPQTLTVLQSKGLLLPIRLGCSSDAGLA